MRFESANPIVPAPWGVEFPKEAEVAPGERKELALRLTYARTNGFDGAAVRITSDFGGAGRPVLSLNLVPGAN